MKITLFIAIVAVILCYIVHISKKNNSKQTKIKDKI